MLLKAINIKKQQNTIDKDNVNVEEATRNEYIHKLQRMLRCKTVYNIASYDDTEFKKFREILVEEFPTLNKQGELMIFGTGCIVYKVQGKSDKNVMLMSHHDVVAANPKEWKYDPFGAEIHDGNIFARGAIDTKTPLFGELQAVEELLNAGYEFPYNVYIASSNNEEVCGDGIVIAVDYFKQNNIHFDFLIDEGGAVVDKQMPGIEGFTAMVAVHEKGRHTYLCTAKKDTGKDSGHSGLTCKTDNPIQRMSEFISEIGTIKWRNCLYDEVKATFRYAAPYMSFPYRYLFSNINVFEPLLIKVLPKVSPTVSAMLGNTVSFTDIYGKGIYEMVQAKEVSATAFFRCCREDDLFSEVETKFKPVADKYGITIEPVIRDYCKPASYENEEFKTIERTVRQIFPRVPVIPFLLTAGSDSRRFTEVADNIYRFAPIVVTSEQFKTIHQPNENISCNNIGEVVCFYKQLLQNLYQ